MTTMKNPVRFLFAALALILIPAFTLAADSEKTKDSAQEPQAKPRVISIKMALTQPSDFKDERVMLVGMFMGYNGSCNTPRPVSSGDVMLQDKQGLCIYVNGPIPEAFDPINKSGLGESIALTGFVITPKQGPPYFKIPYTKSTKNDTLANARAMLLLKKQKADEQAKLLTLEQILRSPDKYVEKFVALKGLPSADAALCSNPPAPVPQDTSEPAWIMRSQDKRCLRIIGPQPGIPGNAEQSGKTPVTIKGYLYKSGEHFFFLVEAEKPAAKKSTIEMKTPGKETAPAAE